MAQPLVSILIPSYNHANYILETLDSILSQDYQNIEIVIIDDGSKDESVERIQKYIEKNQSQPKAFRFLSRSNRGVAKTLNELIEMSQGEYLILYSSDDTLLPGCVSRLVQLAEQNHYPAIVGDSYIIDGSGHQVYVRPSGRIQRKKKFGKSFEKFIEWRTDQKFWFNLKKDFGTYDSLLTSNYIPNGILVRKDAIQKVGLFDAELALQDHEYWLRFCRSYRIAYTPEVLTNYRIHGENSIFRLSERILNDWGQILLHEKSFLKTRRQKCLWYYAYTVLVFRSLIKGNISEIRAVLKQANPLVLLFFFPFVGVHKSITRLSRSL